MSGQLTDPVGPQRDHHRGPLGVLEQFAQERDAFALLDDRNEQLLALVDDQRGGCRDPRLRERPQRVRPGCDDEDLLTLTGQGRGDAGLGQRGLTGP